MTKLLTALTLTALTLGLASGCGAPTPCECIDDYLRCSEAVTVGSSTTSRGAVLDICGADFDMCWPRSERGGPAQVCLD